MANNKIQIKRSINNATVPTLSVGELAFTGNGNVLVIGKPDGTGNIRIGGEQVPGTLTANQALVANATSGIDKVIVANLVPTAIFANGASGTAGQSLTSNSTGGVYWNTPASGVAGSNSQVQFNANGVLAGDAGFTYDGVTDTVTIAGAVNVGANVVVNTTTMFIGNTTANTVRSSVLVQVANSTTTANITAAGIQTFTNSTVNSTMTASLVQVSNSTSTANLTALDLKIGATTVVNSSQITATLFSGNISGSYANISGQVNTATLYAATSANIASAVQANATGVWTTGTVNGATISVGATFIANTTTLNANGLVANLAGGFFTGYANASGFNTTGSTNTATLYATTSANIASAVQANSTGVWTTGTVNAVTLSVGSSIVANTTRLIVGTAVGISVNGSIGTAGQVLKSNGTTGYWDTDQGITSIASGNGITGGTITTTGTLYAVGANGITVTAAGINVLANNGLLANSTGVFVTAANGISVAAGGVAVVAGNGIVSNTTGVFAKAANGISVDASGINVVGSNSIISNTTGIYVQTGSTLTVNTTGIHVNNNLSIQDLTLSGNLTIQGTLTQVDTTNLVVKDPIIKLANGQTTTDISSIGLYGVYGNSTVTQYSGLFRDQAVSTIANGSSIWTLFNSQKEPTTTVDTANSTYAVSTLKAYLQSGALSTNAGSLAITANSTVNVAIVANTLSLTTALPFTSGGTGFSTIAVGDLLVGNSTNTLTKLTAGADGYVLQINGTGVVAWNTLDGGTF